MNQLPFQGYGQNAPGRDMPNEARAQRRQQQGGPLEQAIAPTTPSGAGPSQYPTDETFLQWRQAMQRPKLNAPQQGMGGGGTMGGQMPQFDFHNPGGGMNSTHGLPPGAQNFAGQMGGGQFHTQPVGPRMTGEMIPPQQSAQSNPQGRPMPTPQYLQSLLAGGMDPQAAATQFNQDTHRGYGNEAVYYANNNTIGLPEAYLSNGDQGWNIANRAQHGGGQQQRHPQMQPGSMLNINTQPTAQQTAQTVPPLDAAILGQLMARFNQQPSY